MILLHIPKKEQGCFSMFIWRWIEVTEGAIWRMIPNKMCNCIVITKSIVMELEKKSFLSV
jgi:hypothetical protein